MQTTTELQNPSTYDVITVLRAMGGRISQLEEQVHEMTKGPLPTVMVERQPGFWERVLDPPCLICGAWQADEICPECKSNYGWIE